MTHLSLARWNPLDAPHELKLVAAQDHAVWMVVIAGCFFVLVGQAALPEVADEGFLVVHPPQVDGGPDAPGACRGPR